VIISETQKPICKLSHGEVRFEVMDLGEDIDKERCADESGVEGYTEFMLADFIVHLAQKPGGYCGVACDFDGIWATGLRV